MPAARQRSRSPCMACAVSAMIGTRAAPAASRSRMHGRRLEAVHLGHLHVHQDQRRIGRAMARVHRLAAVGGDGDRGARASCRMADATQLVDRVVLGEQDAQRVPRRAAARPSSAAPGRGSASPGRARAHRSADAGRLARAACVRCAATPARRHWPMSPAGPADACSITTTVARATAASSAASAQRGGRPCPASSPVDQRSPRHRHAPRRCLERQRLGAAGAGVGACPSSAQHSSRMRRLVRVVVDDERAQAVERLGRAPAPPARGARRRQRHGEVERAAARRARSRPRARRPSARRAATRSSGPGRCRRTGASSSRRPA